MNVRMCYERTEANGPGDGSQRSVNCQATRRGIQEEEIDGVVFR